MRFVQILMLSVSLAVVASAQMIKRTDAIWARTAPPGSITLDGRFNESVWAVAESVVVRYGQNAGLPGSGWKPEQGVAPPSDPTFATLKFLVSGNDLYIGAFVRDSSVGGGLFNHFDGFLMNMRNRSSADRPVPVFEYFYGWVTESWADPATGDVGASPGFFGFASGDRTVWDARTTVLGVSNSDTATGGVFRPDTGYVVELRFNLIPRGYDVTRAGGDLIEFNISIYDADWQWPFNVSKFSGNRVWWQGPWGNASAYNVARIYARPGVTTTSGPVPEIPAEVVIPNGQNHPAPAINGQLNESVWANIPGFRIAYGDSALRASYPGAGPYRSGQFQPSLSGQTQKAAVLDPGNARIKWFFKGDTLYIGIDVNDQVVTALNDFDRWDGIRITIDDRGAVNDDKVLATRDLIVRIDSASGGARLGGYLPFLKDSLNGARVGFALKGSSTINNPNDVDEGYQIELAIVLTRLGYPAGRGDGVVYVGITLFDGDKFTNPADDYGTRTWWFREFGGPAGPAWGYMDPNVNVPTSVADIAAVPQEFVIVGNYPNPFNPSTVIHYTLPEPGVITLKVFDILGRNVSSVNIGDKGAGEHRFEFRAANLSSGTYLYRLEMQKSNAGNVLSTPYAKMVLIK